MLITDPLSHLIAEAFAGLPSPLSNALLLLPDIGLVALALLLVTASYGRGPRPLAIGIAAGIGVVVSYGASELLKVLVRDERPCRTLDVLATCPGAGDWAWPSNHATIAAGLATAVVLAVPQWWRYAMLLAGVVALGRVVVGVHDIADVVAGAALGITVTVVVARLLAHRVATLLVRGPAV
ncbi:phosphatase PAP2 family protein [Mumia sp. ZJ430]|uniref:phosphatase PAP2 family protein n=1 Tax=Mumia sp. ZJ430 TaxID=2708083 RepID=UPI00141F45CB|nr:phosphatase PAP2 family protein [Mumia sp. ZJ430]